MKYKFQYNSEEELLELKKEHSDKVVTEVEILFSGNFVTFDDDNFLVQSKLNSNKISILEAQNANLREGLQAVLSGDMQGLAYILYPEDFTYVNKSNTTLEL